MVVEWQPGLHLLVFLPCCLQKQNSESTKAEPVSSQLRVGLFIAGALLRAWCAAADRKSSQREPEKQEMCPVCEVGWWLPRAEVQCASAAVSCSLSAPSVHG